MTKRPSTGEYVSPNAVVVRVTVRNIMCQSMTSPLSVYNPFAAEEEEEW